MLPPPPPTLPSLRAFIESIKDGSSEVKGLYVDKLFAYPIVKQPAGDGTFVSPRAGYLTRFQNAPAIGLLGHDRYVGNDFSKLRIGQVMQVVYGDGHTEYYRVNKISQYQSLQPKSPYSEMVDLTDNKHYSANDVFNAMYGDKNKLVLQTCITKDKDPNWGRKFITASKTDAPPAPVAGPPGSKNVPRRRE